MTEAEWRECADPTAMLGFLRGKASNRKLRLLTSACCRCAENVLRHEPLRRAVETAERYADGRARYREMVQVAKTVEAFSWSASRAESLVARGVWHLVTMGAWWNLRPVRRSERTLLALRAAEPGVEVRFASSFRCIFGYPFRSATAGPWITTDVVALANGIYAEKAFDRMPTLADALMDAGCADEAILNHCRGPGPHVRGCWVIDLLTGRT